MIPRHSSPAPRQSLYLFHPQPPLPGFRAFTESLRGTFPGRKFRHVFYHRFGADRSFPGDPVLDNTVPGCRDVLLAADGRYCPSVSYPPVELSQEQVSELVAITNIRDKNRTIQMHGWQKDHGFVFVDDAGAPVAEIAVGLHSGKVTTRPSNAGLRAGDWGVQRWARLLALIRALDPETERGVEQSSEELQDRFWEQLRRDDDSNPNGPLVHPFLARYLPAYSGVDRLDPWCAAVRQ